MSSQTRGGITVEFGQYEPLTRRLNNLLKEYKDGFSIPKELIQNADDAGATQVHFVYDMRENDDAKTGLLDGRLSEFQGRALWAYNDAVFTNKDFENIRKLGGATKEEDTTKVGKFGLGFNSVYNLTDVPSFISGNQAVIFDPHQHYLGKPGIYTDLSKERDESVRSRWMNQMKPFEGLFGCSLRRTGVILDGTLFRFPLRTQAQAERSEIKQTSYSETQMREFFTVFAKYAGSLLLFTQNVKNVTFSILPKDGHPQRLIQLVTVKKEIQCREIGNSGTPCDSVLQYASSRLEQLSSGGEHDYISEQNSIDVQFEKSSFSSSCGVTKGITTTQWCLTWFCGTKNGKEIAKRSQLKGLIPVGAVAIPLKRISRNTSVLGHISDCGTGFYNVGYLYCFMPLPIATEHPVHINATFALTPDRRQLCCKTEDDTSTAEAEWNEVLKSEVIGYAWIYCLQKCHEICKVKELSFYKFWPNHDRVLTETFCRIIVEGNPRLFFQDEVHHLASFHEMVILDPELRWDETVGDIAFRRLKKFYQSSNVVVADLPKSVIDTFKKCGFQNKIRQKTITVQYFFKDIFFPHLHSLSAEERNKLVIFAVMSNNSDLQQMLSKHRCIPTEPRGTLKMPHETIDPSGEAARLFQSKEEVLLRTHIGFARYPVRQVLRKLGMKQDELSGEEIVGRAKVCEEEKSLPLTRNLLSYLWNTSTVSRNKRRFETIDRTTKAQLGTISFLPVLCKPDEWPFTWKTASSSLASPRDLYHKKVKNLVGCTKLILDNESVQLPSAAEDLWTWLGLKGKDDVTLYSVLSQLWYVSNTANVVRIHQQICQDIYNYIENSLARSYPSEAEVNMSKKLKGKTVIVTDNRLSEPRKTAFDLKLPLNPYLYKVDMTLKENYPKCLKFLGVRKEFESADILHNMGSLQQELNTGRRSHSKLELYIRMVQVLVSVLKEDEDAPQIQLPSTDGKLYDATRLCLNDCGWINKQRHMLFLHPSIPPADGFRLGARTKREASLSGHISSIPCAKGFGQHEELTTRIKRILSGYPKDQSILKELLQNADDAGATELVFIKDFRTHPSQRVFNEKWKLLQGPALCVYNNSHFDEEDMEGLQNLGMGSKATNPLKTGQYGVGFNVVYHLTDVPSFMTVGPGREKTLCVLDPNKSFTPRTEEQSPGIQFTDLEILKDTYCDVFPCYLEESVLTGETGTLFRLPLRTESMAEVSNLSKYETSTHDIEQMLEAFKEEAHASLLFLMNVKKIRFCAIQETTGRLVTDYTVQVSMSEGDLEKEKQFQRYQRSFLEQMTTTHAPEPMFQTVLRKTVTDSRNNTAEYVVIHQVGLPENCSINSTLQKFIKNGDINLLPKGGVAIPVELKSCFKGTLFCILPLPQTTGLPVHINGHFALEHEARRNLWQGVNDYKVMWNELIMTGVVVPAYLHGLQALRKYISAGGSETHLRKSLNWYHSVFPRFCKAKDEYSRIIPKSFYSTIARSQLQLFPMVKGSGSNPKLEWIPVTTHSGFPGIFDNIQTFFNPLLTSTDKRQKQMQIFRMLLIDLGMKLLDSPLHLMEEFDNTEFKGQMLQSSPETLVKFLKSSKLFVESGCVLDALPKHIEGTPMKSYENVVLLTEYCEKYDKYMDELDGLPLMLTQSNVLHRFTCNTTFFITKFHNLLPKSADRFLHESLLGSYRREQVQHMTALNYTDTATFCELLAEEPNMACLGVNAPYQWSNSPPRGWIVRFWDYIQIELTTAIRENQVKPKHEMLTEGQISERVLAPLDQWSFIPVKIDESMPEIYLYPIGSRTSIVSVLQSVYIGEELVKVVRKMKVPKLYSPIFYKESFSGKGSSQVVLRLVGSLDNPAEMLEIVQQTTGKDSNLSPAECLRLLKYFNDRLTLLKNSFRNLSMKLKHLSFWPTLHGEPTSLWQYQEVFSVSSRLPNDSIVDLIAARPDLMILENVYSIKDLLDVVGVQTWSIEDVYNKVIVPALTQLPHMAKLRHLKHIRDNIFGPFYFSQKTGDIKAQILDQLRNIPFIETTDRQHHRVDEFYSHDIELVRVMRPGSLLPSPFDEKDWHSFLKLIGLRCDVSESDFTEFARQLEGEASVEITPDITRKSNLLVRCLSAKLFKNPNFMNNIRAVKFVLPLNVKIEDRYPSLLDIHPQYEGAKHLVSFADSCAPEFCLGVWSVSTMWTSDAYVLNCFKGKQADSVFKSLGHDGKPSPHTLVNHVMKITAALKVKGALFMDSKKAILQELFTFIYEQLEELDASYLQELQETCCIYLPDSNQMVTPRQVMIEIAQSQLIKDFMFRAPTYFGKFFPLFQKLGAQESLSPQTYAIVLQKLFHETCGEEMNPNELKVAIKAFKQLLKLLSENSVSDIDVEKLYLPSSSETLVDSRRLIYPDRPAWKERLSSLQLLYCIEDPGWTFYISELPEKYRMQVVSHAVKERLSEKCSEVMQCSLLSMYEGRIKSAEFINGLLRICHSNNALDTAQAEEIQKKLTQIRLRQVENLETLLEYDDEVVHGSENRVVHFVEHYTEEITLLFETSLNDDIVSDIARALDQVTSGRLGSLAVLVTKMLLIEPEDISSLLDKNNIAACFPYLVDGEPTRFPKPGTLIPSMFHSMLEAGLDVFEVGEYVGLNVFDPYIDNTDDEPVAEDVLPEFVYAIVKKVIQAQLSAPAASEYVVEIKDNSTVNVFGAQLYKFKRTRQASRIPSGRTPTSSCQTLVSSSQTPVSSSQAPEDLEAVLKRIREHLQLSWQQLNSRDWKRVVLRLLFKWHPDKKLENVKFCTEVCQFISAYVKILEDGGSLEDKNGTDTYTAFRGDFRQTWFHREFRRRQNYSRPAPESSSFFHDSVRREKHPHLGEARRWLRQAQIDLDAAKQALDSDQSTIFNWVCFMSQQAAEKALKAVVYTTDSYRADSLRTHNLRDVASGTDIQLQDLAGDLQNEVQDYNRMRYPDRFCFPKIPSDVYTRTQALNFLRMSEKVLCSAGQKISQQQ